MNKIQVILTMLTLVSIGHVVYQNISNYPLVWKIWSRFSLKMLFECALMLSFVVIGYLAFSHYLPFLSWGWMNLVYPNGGNMMITPLLLLTSPNDVWPNILLTIVLVVFIVSLPFMAYMEEVLFRKGHTESKAMIWHSIGFGSIHLIVGVPVSIAILLSFVGLFFASKYVSAYNKAIGNMTESDAEEVGVIHSTTYHTMYNTLAILVFIVAIWL